MLNDFIEGSGGFQVAGFSYAGDLLFVVSHLSFLQFIIAS